MKRLLIAFLFLLPMPAWAADTEPRLKRYPELFGWSGSTAPDTKSIGTVTGANVAFTDLISCGAIASDANGNFYCSNSAGTGTVTSISQGTNMSFSVNPITATGTINLTASPSITNLTASGTVTGLVVSATGALQVGSDYINDITGSGLSIVGGALTASGGSNHNLLSATHSDTSVAGATRGDLIVANSTPAWARFAVGGSNTVLTANGTDPAWSASPTVTSLTANATVTGLVVSTTSALQVGSDYIKDITGNSLSISGGTLNSISPPACFHADNLVDADDNVLIHTARVAETVTQVSCVSSGFTTQPIIVLEDDSGNAMTHATLTCSGTTPTTWIAVTGANSLVAGESLRFDNTQTSTAPVLGTQTDICVQLSVN